MKTKNTITAAIGIIKRTLNALADLGLLLLTALVNLMLLFIEMFTNMTIAIIILTVTSVGIICLNDLGGLTLKTSLLIMVGVHYLICLGITSILEICPRRKKTRTSSASPEQQKNQM
jgi:hypothetical protein